MDSRVGQDGSDFLTGGGEMGARMRAHDWSHSPLGPPEQWPQSLRTVVSLLLTSRFPMFVAWGPELGFLYNDGYASILGAKHPAALGRRFQDIWFEIWSDIGPLVDRALAGEATFHENLPLRMLRKGYEEQTYFTFSYSPVRDETGGIGGMFCACTETTSEVYAQASLRAEKEHLHELFHQAPGFMAVLRGPDHVFELTNAAYLQLVGHRELVGKSVRKALPDVAGQGFFELLDRVYTTGKPFVGRRLRVAFHRGPDGAVEERFVDFVYQPIGGSGQVTGIFVEGHDVTESVRFEQALRTSEERLRLSQEAGGIGTFELFPLEGRVAVSEQFRRLWSLPPQDEFPIEDLLALIHPDDQARVGTGARELADGALDYLEYRIIRRDTGETRWMARRGQQVDEEGALSPRYLGVSYDITEQKRAEAALRESEERLRALADNLPFGMVYQVAMQPDGSNRRFTFVSRGSERLSGISAESALRDPAVLYETILPQSQSALRAAEEAAIADLKPMDVEVAFRRADGSTGWCRIISAPRRVLDGSLLWDGVQVDITESKLAEEHQRLLINELNHRVKNTLTTVQSIASQTLRNAPTTEEARQAFEARLLALSRAHDVLTRENWEGAGLYEIVTQAVAPYRNLREDRVHLAGSDVRLPPRMALALAMALQELATNGVKYGALSNDTGEIRIAWSVERSAEPPRLHLRWEEAGGPRVTPPKRRGFGSRLIERSLAQDLDGTVKITFQPAGVTCTVDAPIVQSELLTASGPV